MKSIFRSNLFILLLVVFQVLSQLILVNPLIKLMGYSNLLAVDEYIFLLLPVVLYIIITKQSPKEVFRLNKLPLVDAVVVIVIAGLCLPIASFLSYLTSLFFQNPVSDAFTKLSSVPLYAMLFMMALTPAICEEAVTRGVVLHGYNKTSILQAALVNGLVFCILHLSPQQSLYTFALGFIFAYIVRITNSIFASALCHFTFNSIQVTMSRVFANYVNTAKTQSEVMANVSPVQIIESLVILFVVAAVCGTVIYALILFLESRHRIYPQGYVSNNYMNNGYGNNGYLNNGSMGSGYMNNGYVNNNYMNNEYINNAYTGYNPSPSDVRPFLYNNRNENNGKEEIGAYIPLILLVIFYIIIMALFYVLPLLLKQNY